MSSSRFVASGLPRARHRQRAVAHVEQARVAADRQRPAAHDLHPGVLLRVVRRGHRDAAVELELADREIDHLRADHPEIEHLGSGIGCAFAHRRRHRRRRDAHVAADGDAFRLELLDERPADAVAAVLVDLRRVDPADVVRLEDFRLEHAPTIPVRFWPSRG